MHKNIKCVKDTSQLFLFPIEISPAGMDKGIFCVGRSSGRFTNEEIRFLNLVVTQLNITFLRIIELRERERSIVQNILYNFPEGVILIDDNLKVLLFNKIGEGLISKFGQFSERNQLLKFKNILIGDLISSQKKEVEIEVGNGEDLKILKLMVQPLDISHSSPTWIILVSDVTEHRTFQRKIHRMLEGTVYSLALAIERRDPYTAGHQKKCCQSCSRNWQKKWD